MRAEEGVPMQNPGIQRDPGEAARVARQAAEQANQAAEVGAVAEQEAPAEQTEAEAAPASQATQTQRPMSGGFAASLLESQAGQLAPAGAARAANPIFDDVRSGSGSLIRSGDSGPKVAEMQKLLNSLGIQPPLEETGTFDAATAAAVRKFQQENGCLVDGIIGPETMGALDRKCGLEPNAAAAEASERYRARSSGGGGASGAGGAGGAGGATGVDIPGAGGDVSMSSADRIMERTAQFESGGRYDAWNPNDAGP
jgi:hypothetical protein